MYVELRNTGMIITPRERAAIEERLRTALSRYGDDVRSAVMRLRDVNGPRGGVDVRCHLAVATYGGVNVLIDERGDSVRAAIDVALDRATANLARAVHRSRGLRGREFLRVRNRKVSGGLQ